MKKREAIVIVGLIVAALALPAFLLWNGMSDAAEREWFTRPYEGALEAFQAEHIDALNEVVRIFAAHPEFPEQYASWSGAGVARVAPWSILHGYPDHTMLSEAEWTAVQRFFGAQGLLEVIWRPGVYSRQSGWLEIPVLDFSVRTTAEGWEGRLLWLPADAQPEEAAQVLAMLGELYEEIGATMYPGWYAANE